MVGPPVEHDVRSLYEAVVGSAGDAIVSVDPAGTIRSWNPAAERLFGYAADEMVGLQTPAVLHDHDEVVARAAELSERLGETITPGVEVFWALPRRQRTEQREWTYIHKDGRRFKALLSVSAIRDDAGEITGFVGIATDLSRLNAAREALRVSEGRLERATRGSSDGLWDWDTNTDVVWFSERLKAMLGFRDDEFPNTFGAWEARLHDEDRARTLQAVQDHLQDRRPYDVEYRLRTKTDEWRWFRDRGQAVWDEQGKAVRMSGSIQDVTDRHEIMEALELSREEEHRAREVAEEASQAKSRFLANMSHELRTPLNAIIGYSELMLEEDDALGERARDLQRIAAAGRHLLGLINDVLDLSKAESDRLELAVEPFVVCEVVSEVVDVVRPMAEQQADDLSLSCSPELGTAIGDRLKLRQCLLNVVGNAVKFTRDGRVDVAAERSSEDGIDWLVLTVADTGIGVDPVELESLFEPFVQVVEDRPHTTAGTGLGLSISRRLCRFMGGDITVRSTPGTGSTFQIRLPADLTPRAGDLEVPAAPKVPPG